MHGALRYGLRSQQGMDEVDARRSYEVVYGYLFKQERREADLGVREAKRQKVSNKHNNTKAQLAMISTQLTDYLPQWLKQAKELLQQRNHGIPTVTQIEDMGRRKQDKEKISNQVDAHNEKAASLRRQKLTIADIKQEADKTVPSNDKILRMGVDRLQRRERINEVSVQKFWKELKVDGKAPAAKDLWMSAIKTFPHLLPFHRHGTAPTIIKSRGAAFTVIGKYLALSKNVTKSICDFCYGTDKTSRNFVPKRDRNFIKSDLLEWLNFVQIVDISEDTPDAVVESAAATCLSSFLTVEEHYTYTLSDDDDSTSSNDVPTEVVHVSTSNNDVPTEVVDIGDADADEAQSNVGSNNRRRSSRRRRRPNHRHKYPGEESSEEETDDLGDEDLSLLYVDLRNIT